MLRRSAIVVELVHGPYMPLVRAAATISVAEAGDVGGAGG